MTTTIEDIYRFCNWKNKRYATIAPREHAKCWTNGDIAGAVRHLGNLKEESAQVGRELVLHTRGDGERHLYLVEHRKETKKNQKGAR